METLPPVEQPQFSAPLHSAEVASVAPAPVSQAPEQGASFSNPQTSLRKKQRVILIALALFFLGAFIFWFARGGNAPANLQQDSFDEFSQSGSPAAPNTVSQSADVREDSPGFVGGKVQNNDGQSVTADGCTLDTKICPDGSFVERQGSNCEFAACAATGANVPAGWKQFRSDRYRYSVSYPAGWRAEEKVREDSVAYLEISPDGFVWDPSDENSPLPPRLLIEPVAYFSDLDGFPVVTRNGISLRQQSADSGNIFYVPIPQRSAEYLSITGGERNSGRAEDEVLREIFATFRIF